VVALGARLRVGPVAGGLAPLDGVRVPRCAIAPVLHAAVHRVDLVRVRDRVRVRVGVRVGVRVRVRVRVRVHGVDQVVHRVVRVGAVEWYVAGAGVGTEALRHRTCWVRVRVRVRS